VANPLKAPNDRPKCPVPKYTAVRVSSVIPYQSTETGRVPTVPGCESFQVHFHFVITLTSFCFYLLGDAASSTEKYL